MVRDAAKKVAGGKEAGAGAKKAGKKKPEGVMGGSETEAKNDADADDISKSKKETPKKRETL